MGTSFHVPRSDNLHQKQSVLPPDLKDKRSQALWDGVYIKIDQPIQMEWSKVFIKILRISFGNSILDNSNWDKISESIIKNSISGTE